MEACERNQNKEVEKMIIENMTAAEDDGRAVKLNLVHGPHAT